MTCDVGEGHDEEGINSVLVVMNVTLVTPLSLKPTTSFPAKTVGVQAVRCTGKALSVDSVTCVYSLSQSLAQLRQLL